jgi:hypothetical protein
MMTLKSKDELADTIRPRYLQASKAAQQKILDEFIAATEYHRKYAIRLLRRPGTKPPRKKRTAYQTRYRGEVVDALVQIWEIFGHLCSKRLQPFLPEAIQVLERCHEIELTAETKARLLQISSVSIDRCLRPYRLPPARGGEHHQAWQSLTQSDCDSNDDPLGRRTPRLSRN